MGDDTILEAIGKGSIIKATMQAKGKILRTTITQVLHVPKMNNSFIFCYQTHFGGFESKV
jgi:hypothetical protein